MSVGNIGRYSEMKVALDIDGTISEHPEFFAVLSSALRAAGHQVLVLTYRDPNRVEAAKAQLAGWRVEFDELVIADSLESKGQLCPAHGVDIFFDDQDECIAAVPEHILVCKVRNGGNFDFHERRWISTGRLVKLFR
jgi:uncharacterized HAD superfamily protein